jgi:hypothetical protein
MKGHGLTLTSFQPPPSSSLLFSSDPLLAQAFNFPAMAASHQEMFKPSSIHEGKIIKLIENHLLPNRVLQQWRPAKDEDIPTPNTNEIVVSTSFYCGFGIPSCNFLCGLLHHYKIELVHLNPNSILQIAIFVHLCEAYLRVPLNFLLFKHHFFLKYQPNADKHHIFGGVGIQAHQHHDFLTLPLKTSLKSWHKQWFYCENHEPSLPPFVGRLPKYDATWVEEPTCIEMLIVSALPSRANELKGLSLTRVGVVTN